MNAAQIHLALNHAPLFLSVIGGGILLLGMFRKNDSYVSLSLYFLIAAALFTVPVFQTGEGTEELVEKAAGVNENAIEAHENMAKTALVVIMITGALALAAVLFRKSVSIRRLLLPATLLLSLASFVTMAQTAHLGGLIRHTELQTNAQAGTDAVEKEKDNKEKKEENEGKKDLSADSSMQKKAGTVSEKDDDD
ncbi:MAG: hypothetical protein J0M10_01180 [Chitinophagales bacterium]|nr:hypothetical protein [Chitinophagales bacterium]